MVGRERLETLLTLMRFRVALTARAAAAATPTGPALTLSLPSGVVVGGLTGALLMAVAADGVVDVALAALMVAEVTAVKVHRRLCHQVLQREREKKGS